VRVVVTGALGHIGSRLIRECAVLLPGAEVVMIDNLATERYASLFNLPNGCRYRFVEADILTADLERAFVGADAVVHLAAVTHGAGVDQLARMERVNVEGSERVARACAALGIGLLFPSTTSVYGVPHGIVAEDCEPEHLKPQSPYAAWKLRSEQQLVWLAAQTGLRFVVLRMGTVFGPSPGMRFHTAVGRFCWRAVSGQPIEVWTTASHQFRPYLDLTDAVRAMIFMLKRAQFDGLVYNVLTLNATVLHVIDVLRTFVPELSISYVDSPLMNNLSYCVDHQRLTQLGCAVRGSLERGIGDTVAVARGHIASATARNRSGAVPAQPGTAGPGTASR
jgi:nucleoside-diphosphate-sugar epimerase